MLCGQSRFRAASGEQAPERLVARAALDQRADVRGARGDERDVALADRRLLGEVAGAQERLADLERELRARGPRSRARGGGTRCGTRRTCPCRRGGAASGAPRAAAAAGRRRSRCPRRRPRRGPPRGWSRRSPPRVRRRPRPGRPPRRAPISARHSQRSSPTGSVSSRSPAGSCTASMLDAIELLGVILERQRQQLEHVGGRRDASGAARCGPASARPRARHRRRAAVPAARPRRRAPPRRCARAARRARAVSRRRTRGATSATPSLVSA